MARPFRSRASRSSLGGDSSQGQTFPEWAAFRMPPRHPRSPSESTDPVTPCPVSPRGYATKHVVEGLEPRTLYRFRLKVSSPSGEYAYSPVASASTTSEYARAPGSRTWRPRRQRAGRSTLPAPPRDGSARARPGRRLGTSDRLTSRSGFCASAALGAPGYKRPGHLSQEMGGEPRPSSVPAGPRLPVARPQVRALSASSLSDFSVRLFFFFKLVFIVGSSTVPVSGCLERHTAGPGC